jgi:hypothetical protein
MQAEAENSEHDNRFNSPQYQDAVARHLAEEKAAAEEAEARRVRDSPAIEVNVILKDGSPDGGAAFSDLAVNVKQLETIGPSLARELGKAFDLAYVQVEEAPNH